MPKTCALCHQALHIPAGLVVSIEVVRIGDGGTAAMVSGCSVAQRPVVLHACAS